MAQWNKRYRLLFRWSLVSGVILIATIAWALANRKPGEDSNNAQQRDYFSNHDPVLSRDAHPGIY